jgi:hypothetical protein
MPRGGRKPCCRKPRYKQKDACESRGAKDFTYPSEGRRKPRWWSEVHAKRTTDPDCSIESASKLTKTITRGGRQRLCCGKWRYRHKDACESGRAKDFTRPSEGRRPPWWWSEANSMGTTDPDCSIESASKLTKTITRGGRQRLCRGKWRYRHKDACESGRAKDFTRPSEGRRKPRWCSEVHSIGTMDPECSIKSASKLTKTITRGGQIESICR